MAKEKAKHDGLLCFLLALIVVLILVIGGAMFFWGMEKGNNIDHDIEPQNTSIPTGQDDKQNQDTSINETTGIDVVPTMQDEIAGDSSWCGTFQLVWNDMKNDVVKKDVIFVPQEKMAENLNKEEFTEDMLSDEYYYKIYGLKSLELKEKIEKGIKEKFNQESDILDDFDWSENALNDSNNTNVRRYFFYAMLYRKFDFFKKFDKLEDGKFGNKYSDVKYFGIDGSTDDEVREQVDVLYYNSKDDFAVLLNTKTDDEVIFCKNPEGNNFKEIYDNINQNIKKYKGSKNFENIDEFKAPNLAFNEKREYEELQGKEFETADKVYSTGVIEKAIQTIKFSLDEKGGEIKSEAAIDMVVGNAIMIDEPEETPRYFYVDDTFALFLREKGQKMPYFAAKIDDITKFQ